MALRTVDADVTHDNASLWYVIRTKRGDEHRVEANLANQGIEVFLPLVEVCQNNHGKMVWVIKPLFPCYLFARLDLKIHYQKVKFTRGVNKILGISDSAFPISDEVIETIKARMGKDNPLKLKGKWKGDDATVTDSSPFKGLR